MRHTDFGCLLFLAGALIWHASPAQAEVGSASVGTEFAYGCTGTYDASYSWKVVSNEGGKVRMEGLTGGKAAWVEKPTGLFALSIFYRRDRGDGKGQRAQSFDLDDLAAFKKLEPGTEVELDVRERMPGSKWEWGYEIAIGSAKTVDHPVAGKIEVVPITEKRRVYRGKYSSTMTTDVMPSNGLVTGWVYKDREGTQTCDLTSLKQP